MNKVILRGNVGQDPKITTFDNGGKVAQFSLATTERGYKTKDGKEIEEKTDWHNIIVRRTKLAEVCEQYVRKGTPLLIIGKLQNRSYEDSAKQKKYITEVSVEEMEMLGGKRPEGAPAPEPEPELGPGLNGPARDGGMSASEKAIADKYQPIIDAATAPDGADDLPF